MEDQHLFTSITLSSAWSLTTQNATKQPYFVEILCY